MQDGVKVNTSDGLIQVWIKYFTLADFETGEYIAYT